MAKFAFLPLAASGGLKLAPTDPKAWTFVPAEHSNIHSLSQAQCSSAFPELYDQLLDTATRRYNTKGPIRYDEVKIAPGRCMLQVLLYEGEV